MICILLLVGIRYLNCYKFLMLIIPEKKKNIKEKGATPNCQEKGDPNVNTYVNLNIYLNS